jgi:hypothetical protein
MKKTILTLACIIAFLSASVAQEKAKVYFIRQTGFYGSAVNFKIYIDQKLTCLINNKRYSIFEVDAGTHEFSVQLTKEYDKESQNISINMEAGKEYYLEIVWVTKRNKSTTFISEIKKEDADDYFKRLKKDDCL